MSLTAPMPSTSPSPTAPALPPPPASASPAGSDTAPVRPTSPPSGSGPTGLRAQAGAWARSTPGWLRLGSIALALAIALGVVVAVGVTAHRQAAAHRAQVTTAGALVDAQQIYTSLSAADTAAAELFLPGVSDSAALDATYRNQIAQANTYLARAAQLGGGSPQATQALHDLSVNLPIYTGLVATARANDRAGLNLVGTAYLSEANHLMSSVLLPAADTLYQVSRGRLDGDYGTGTNPVPLILGLLLLAAAVVGLVLVQLRYRQRFNRTLNPGLALATVCTLGVMVWFGFALKGEGSQLGIAQHQGSDPIAAFTQARILAQRLRADDELTLVTRDAVSTYQTDYTTRSDQLDALLSKTYPAGLTYQPLRDSARRLPGLSAVHGAVRADDAKGDLQGANQAAAGAGAGDLPALYDQFDGELDQSVGLTQENFIARAAAAQNDLSWIYVGLIGLGLAAIALVLWGAQQRIEEYR